MYYSDNLGRVSSGQRVSQDLGWEHTQMLAHKEHHRQPYQNTNARGIPHPYQPHRRGTPPTPATRRRPSNRFQGRKHRTQHQQQFRYPRPRQQRPKQLSRKPSPACTNTRISARIHHTHMNSNPLAYPKTITTSIPEPARKSEREGPRQKPCVMCTGTCYFPENSYGFSGDCTHSLPRDMHVQCD